MLRLVMAWAVAAALSLAMTAHASADPCGGFSPGCGCGPAVAVVEPCGPLVESYLVNQGPTFSGPGHYLRQAGGSAPCCYPYVGFIYSGYPYGAFGPGGYPRGYYSPYIGYPYAEPYPYGLRYASRGGAGHLPRGFYHRRVHGHRWR